MVEAITFSELRSIQKQEKDSEELTDLDDNFVLKVSAYLSAKEDIGEEREYRNAKRVFSQIMNMRRRKVTQNAIIHAKTDLNQRNLNLLPEEQGLFRELKAKFESHMDQLEEKLNSTSPQMEEETESFEENSENEDSVGEDMARVKIMSEVPEFMGTDLESYGPFEEGEETEIPEDNAEILANRGSAEVIER